MTKQPLFSIASFSPSLGLSVAGKTPLITATRVKNNTATLNLYKDIGFLLGVYNAEAKTFNCIGMTIDGKAYVCGCFGRVTISGPGSEELWGLVTYAPNVGEAMTLSAYCFICEGKYGLGEKKVNWGGSFPNDPNNGNWIILIEWSKFKFLVDGGILDAVQIFPNVLTVTPAA